MDEFDTSPEVLQRISRLEGRMENEERSIEKRVSLWGGIIALMISLIIGTFQIYEYTILRQSEAREAKIIQIGTFVRRITELNSEISRLSVFTDTPEKMARANVGAKIINGEKLSIVRLADRLLQEDPDAGGFAAYATIAYEMLTQGNNSKALEYANAALEKSQTVPEKIEAQRYIARILFAPGVTQDIQEARKVFLDAKSLALNETSYLRSQLTASAISDLVVSEALFGDCDQSKLAMDELETLMATEDSALVFQLSIGEIRNSLIGSRKCPNLFR